jgi:hypothetical protein
MGIYSNDFNRLDTMAVLHSKIWRNRIDKELAKKTDWKNLVAFFSHFNWAYTLASFHFSF